MRLTRFTFIVLTVATFVFANFPATNFAQEAKGALLRGYRTGYSDGYMSGYRDLIERADRNFAKKPEYMQANRVYRSDYGSLEEYRDGYQQGFETGYHNGFERQAFNAALPTNLTRRGAKNGISPGVEKDQPEVEKNKLDTKKSEDAQITAPVLQENLAAANLNANIPSGEPTIIIPTNTEIVVEMLADIDTENSREGDPFLARVVAPEEIKNFVIEGRVAKIKKPGRVKGNAELQLSFSRIVLNETRWANFNAIVIEALPSKENNIKAIDEEGTVLGKSSLKSDVIKVSAATGTGATVGAITGGLVGAAVGAAVGGAVGVGGVLIARGKEINLTQGQQIRVRTNFESQIR